MQVNQIKASACVSSRHRHGRLTDEGHVTIHRSMYIVVVDRSNRIAGINMTPSEREIKKQRKVEEGIKLR